MLDTSQKRRFFFNTDAFYYYEILKNQWRIVLLFCFSAVFCSLALTFLTSEKYQATAGIFYRPQESTVLRLKTTESFGAPVPSPPFKVINQTLYDIVKSDVILTPVVASLGLDKKEPPPRDNWFRYIYSVTKDWLKERGGDCISLLKYGRIIDENPTAKAIRTLSSKISLSTKRDSYVLTLSVKDTKPDRAAKIIDAVGANLVAWLKTQDVSSFEQKLAQLKNQLEAKEQELSGMRAERAGLLLAGRVASITEETEKTLQNLYEMELDAARLNSLIEEKRRRLSSMEVEIKQTNRYINPEDMKKVKTARLFESVELNGLLAKQSDLHAAMTRLKSRLQQFPDLQKKLEQLDMLISAGTHEFQQLSDIYLESSQKSITARSEIRVIHPAAVPTSPVQPIKVYHVALTAIMSLIVGVSLVYLLAFFNVRLFFISRGIAARNLNHEPVVSGENHG